MDTVQTICIHRDYNVVIARRQLPGGTLIEAEHITVAGLLAKEKDGNAAGQPVRRYGQCWFPFNVSLLIFQLALLPFPSCHQPSYSRLQARTSSISCSASSFKMPAAAASMSKSKMMDSVFLQIVSSAG